MKTVQIQILTREDVELMIEEAFQKNLSNIVGLVSQVKIDERPKQLPLDAAVGELCLPSAMLNVLYRRGWTTIRHLTNITKAALRRERGCGSKMVQEVEHRLHANGYRFRIDVNDPTY